MISTQKALTLALLMVFAAPCNAMFNATKNLFAATAVFGRKLFLNRPVICTTSGYALGKTAEYFMQNPDKRTPINQLTNPFSKALLGQAWYNAKVNGPAVWNELREDKTVDSALTTAQETTTSYWNSARQKFDSLFDSKATSVDSPVDQEVTSEEKTDK